MPLEVQLGAGSLHRAGPEVREYVVISVKNLLKLRLEQESWLPALGAHSYGADILCWKAYDGASPPCMPAEIPLSGNPQCIGHHLDS
jgi:hypothetical protein